MNFDKMQRRWCAGGIRQASVTEEGGGGGGSEIQRVSGG